MDYLTAIGDCSISPVRALDSIYVEPRSRNQTSDDLTVDATTATITPTPFGLMVEDVLR